MLLIEKYTPHTLNGFIGNPESIEKLREFGCSVQAGKKPKPIIVYGPSGTGKTAAVKALASSNGFEIAELTSSDYRDADALKKKLLPAASSRGLFSRVTLILLDEIDELSSKFDKGAESVILQILQEAKQPIAFTANDYWNQRISFLRGHAEKVEFKKIGTNDLCAFLKKIVKSEKKQVEDDVLNEIAVRSDGDVRGAINDLELILQGGANALEVIGIRNRKLEIFRVLDKIFLSNNFFAAKSAVDDSDVDMDMLMNWVEENIPNRYFLKQTLSRAYSELAFASRFFEKAERVRYYGYLKYAAIGMSSGVSISSDGNSRYVSPYAFPAKVKYLSVTKAVRGVKNRIAGKLSPFLHTNKNEIINSYIPLLKRIMEKKTSDEEKEELNGILEVGLRLEKDEIAYLKKSD